MGQACIPATNTKQAAHSCRAKTRSYRSIDSHPSPHPPTQAKRTWHLLSWENAKGMYPSFHLQVRKAGLATSSQLIPALGSLRAEIYLISFASPWPPPALVWQTNSSALRGLLINAHLPPVPQSLACKDRCRGPKLMISVCTTFYSKSLLGVESSRAASSRGLFTPSFLACGVVSP